MDTVIYKFTGTFSEDELPFISNQTERGLETDCGWFTFVLLWHVPYMQDPRRSSAERLISTAINCHVTGTQPDVKNTRDIMSTSNTCPQRQASCVANTTLLLHTLLQTFDLQFLLPKSNLWKQVQRDASVTSMDCFILHLGGTDASFVCASSWAFSVGHERLDKNA